jgi:Tfp pilus assembly protein PilO
MKNINLKINNQTKITISILATFVFCSLVGYFGIFSPLGSIRESEDKIVIQKIEQDKKYKDSIVQKQLVTKMKMVESQLKRVDSIFVNKDRMLDFVTTIEGIAANDRINMKINISESASPTAGFYKNTLEISAKGNYLNIINFVEDLELLNYYINIRLLDIQKTTEDIYMNMSAEFYSK